MSLFLSLLVSISMAQEIRLRLLHHQKSIPVLAENIQLSEGTAQALTITYSEPQKKWLVLNQKNNGLSTEAAKTLELKAENAIIHGRKLSGKFKLVWNEKNKSIDLIYPMDIDKYLLGVLPAEMPASWPLEALKAQAVASRSYVLAQMQGQTHRHFDVDSSVMDQVFNKKKFEVLPANLKEKIRAAILQTQKEVLFKGNRVYKTYFHARCGGHTENPKLVWNDSWSWNGKKDPYCDLGNAQNWAYSISIDSLAQAYADDTNENIGTITKIVAGKKTNSGRSDHIFLFFEDGRIRKWSSQNLRKSIGFSNIKSTLFNIVLNKETVSFRGKGFGHGVGLCQFGSRQMASLGKKHSEILEFYYPDAQLRSVFQWPAFLAKLQEKTLQVK
ncbi:MAG: SpoIID/LytB domain-containing protein [Bdellovibrionales bacterium]|nr:SpoIID/LytB domain-containing protein [Bdellovibrionales bacterium]